VKSAERLMKNRGRYSRTVSQSRQYPELKRPRSDNETRLRCEVAQVETENCEADGGADISKKAPIDVVLGQNIVSSQHYFHHFL